MNEIGLLVGSFFILGVVPAIPLALFAGGPWVFRLWLLMMTAIVAYMAWSVFVHGDFNIVGIETSLLLLGPGLALSITFGALFGWALAVVFQGFISGGTE